MTEIRSLRRTTERPVPAKPARPLTVSVVIPALNEEKRIGGLLAELRQHHRFHEVWVVDGGSTDATVGVVEGVAGVGVVRSGRGRAVQMNAGAAEASGDVLLFLHADARLPPDAAALVTRALADPRAVAGAFHTRTVCDDPDAPNRWLTPLLRLADLHSRYSRLLYGDEAIFVRAATFRQVGGYPEIPLMEDIALSQRVRRVGRLTRVPATVRVSGRRFLARPVVYTALTITLPILYRLGVPPARLASLYGVVR